MKRTVLIKGILLLIVVSLAAMGFAGCGSTPPLCITATVNITTPLDSYSYEIYIDGTYWQTTNSSGNTTIYNVPIGYHAFYAEATDCSMSGCWNGYAYPTIICGVNNVAINTYTSCSTATVNIDIQNDSYSYKIYIDGTYWKTTNSSGNATIYNVPTGNHTFYAVATDYLYEGTVYNVNITCGVNTVVIPVY